MNRRHLTAAILATLGTACILAGTFGVRTYHFGLPIEAVEPTQQFVASLQSLSVVGADSDSDNQKKRVVLDPLLLKANGGTWPWSGPQETGDCAAMTFGTAIEIDQAVQIDGGADIQFRPVFRPWLYSGGRTRGGKVALSGEGSVPAWIVEFVESEGVLWADEPGVPKYDGKTAVAWGKKTPPKEFGELAKQYTVNNIAAVRSAQDACNAIVAGYPVAFGSMKFGTDSIKVVNGRNIARDTTNWPHAQCCTGYDGTMGGQRLFRIVNSWLPWPSVKSQMPGDHPGGYYVTWEIMDAICKEGMAFAVSGTTGFKQREFRPDFSVIGAAAPPAEAQALQETAVMFPLSPDLQVPLYAVGGVLCALAVALVLWGNRRGRTVAGAAALMLAAMLPTAASAQEFRPDFATLTTAANSPSYGSTSTSGLRTANSSTAAAAEFAPDFALLATTANTAPSAGIRASVTTEPPAVDFSRLLKAAGCKCEKCDCLDCDGIECECKVPKLQASTLADSLLAGLDGYREQPRPVNHVWTPTRQKIIEHLLGGNGGANHKGVFQAESLAPLTDSQLLELHDNHHATLEKPAATATHVGTWPAGWLFGWPGEAPRTYPKPGYDYPEIGVYVANRKQPVTVKQPAKSGRWVSQCFGGQCRLVWVEN